MPTLNDTQFKSTMTILVPYATDRFYLKQSQVEMGWLVLAYDTLALYVIKDTTQLATSNGYTNLTSGGGGGGGDLLAENNLSDVASVAQARTNLGLVIGTNVQAYDADLTTWAGKTAPSGTVVGTSDVQTLTNKTLTSPAVSGPTLSGTVVGTYTLGGTPTFPATVATTTGAQTLTNKTLTAPVIATISNTGTLTLPTSTDTLVGRATTDTLTNKTLTAPVLGGTVTGTYTLGGTPTFPASVATLSGVQTLTNKTISGAALTGLTTAEDIDATSVVASHVAISSALASDDTYSGFTHTGRNAGATIAQWEAVYLGASSTWLLADANGSGTYPARGLATAAYVSTNAATILTYGYARNDAWAWTPGGDIYLSATAGGLTQTAPSTSGDKVQKVGYAVTADIAFFDFNSTYLEVA